MLRGNLVVAFDYRRALVCISLRRLFFRELFSSVFPKVAALASSSRPILSASAKTRVLTVAPSRRFLLHDVSYYLLLIWEMGETCPSLLECAIISAKCHSLPCGMIPPPFLSRVGVQSVASLTVVGIFEPLILDKTIIPSSSNNWNAFLSVSLFTASK